MLSRGLNSSSVITVPRTHVPGKILFPHSRSEASSLPSTRFIRSFASENCPPQESLAHDPLGQHAKPLFGRQNFPVSIRLWRFMKSATIMEIIRTKHDDVLRVLASPAALARRRDHFGDSANVEECCEPYFFGSRFNP